MLRQSTVGTVEDRRNSCEPQGSNSALSMNYQQDLTLSRGKFAANGEIMEKIDPPLLVSFKNSGSLQ
jgi:hypothetical protein